jgi:2-(1,2-epoxy-1,2-dihydrophenyl)acetyl-CoA isomerase
MTELEQHLIVEQIEGLAVLRFNRPASLNALSEEIREGLAREVPRLVAAADVRAIMITGTGRAFCAGGEVGGMTGPGDADTAAEGMRSYHGWLTMLRHSEKLVITAVNGTAAGGGFGLAMIGDLVVASEAAYFKTAFTRLGVAADYALGFTLPRAVGEVRAAEILFCDRRVPAAEALAIGMVARTFPAETFVDDALAFSLEMARTACGAQLTKRLLRASEREAFERYLETEAVTQGEAFQSRDCREGVAAFLGKRAPIFEGR